MDAITKNAGLDVHVAALANVTDKPTLVGLSYALRHPETWPKGFVWDYNDCRTCAVGLAVRLWNLVGIPLYYGEDGMSSRAVTTVVSHMSREVALGYTPASDIFFGVRPRRSLFLKRPVGNLEDVTPEQVADEIDRYLATKA